MSDCPYDVNGLCRALLPHYCTMKCEAKNEDGVVRYGEPMTKRTPNITENIPVSKKSESEK